MLFCKLLAGALLVGGIAQASYCFDVTSLIKNQITSQTQAEKNMLPIKDAEITLHQQNITNKRREIEKAEDEIKEKYIESEKKWSDSQSTWWFSNAKKSIPELKKSLEEEKKLIEEAKAATQLMTEDIKTKKVALEKTQSEINDPSTSFFTRLSHNISALKQEAVIKIKEQQLSWQVKAENTAEQNATYTTETLKIETDLQVQRDNKNVLIYELQAVEELLEE